MPCRHALSSAKRSDVSKATDTMAESSLIEALAPDVSPLLLLIAPMHNHTTHNCTLCISISVL